mmetsp:Transcript_4105/g.14489  ORF Transcript_4105/g.14489 Transcript_4105/m.14489 type:complete len:294 (-) Transcript_4105:143-1024(-)
MPRLKQPPSITERLHAPQEPKLPLLRQRNRKRNRYDMRKLSEFDYDRMQYLCFKGRFCDIRPMPEPLSRIIADPQCTSYMECTHLQLEQTHTLIQLSCRLISDKYLMTAGLQWSLDWLIKQFKKHNIRTIIEYVSYGFSSRSAFRKAMTEHAEFLAAERSALLCSAAASATDALMPDTLTAQPEHASIEAPEDTDTIMESTGFDTLLTQEKPKPFLPSLEPTTPAAAFAAKSSTASAAWLTDYLSTQLPSNFNEPPADDQMWSSGFRYALCSSSEAALQAAMLPQLSFSNLTA